MLGDLACAGGSFREGSRTLVRFADVLIVIGREGNTNFLLLFVIVAEGILYIFRKVVRLGFKLTIVVRIELVFVLHSFCLQGLRVFRNWRRRDRKPHSCLRRGL